MSTVSALVFAETMVSKELAARLIAAVMFAAVTSFVPPMTNWSTPGGPAATAVRGRPLMVTTSPAARSPTDTTCTWPVAEGDGATSARQTSKKIMSVRFTVELVPS